MPRAAVYLLYNLLLPIALLVGFPSFIVKGIRRGGLARNFRQRFGRFRPGTLRKLEGENPLWVHAVSVGEIFLALKIIGALHDRAPDLPVVLSTTTTTGFAVANERASGRLTVIHNPVDLPLVVSRVVRALRPAALVLVEAEVWPNLVRRLGREGVPVILANARLSPRSERRYRKFRSLVEPIFSQLDAVTVPFEADRARWASLGVPAERITTMGSVKFDDASLSGAAGETGKNLGDWLERTGLPPDARLLLGGSTHPGEELLLAETAAQLRETIPDLALVIVPRHAERGPEIAAELRARGYPAILRDAPRDGVPDDTDPLALVRIANTTGELRAWFHLAEVVVIGKSLRAEGGQNPVEPILAGKPVVVGPGMQNFSDVVADLVAARGIRQVASEEELLPALRELLENPEASRAMAGRGASAMERHRGAARRTADFLVEKASLLDHSESVAGQDAGSPPP